MNGMAELARAIVGSGYKPRSSEHLATVVRQSKDGTYWVHIPGGADETPITTPIVEASEGDTVRVTISGGRSVMSGNVTSPSASMRSVTKVGGIANMALTTAYSESARIDRLETTTLTAESALITDLQAEAAKVSNLTAEQLSAATGYVNTLTTNNVSAQNLVADHASFPSVQANAAKVDDLTAENLEASVGYIDELLSANISAGTIESVTAAIEELDVESLSATYAAIDLSNVNAEEVGKAKIHELFAESGLFEDLTITGDGTVTGKLNAVLLDGDTARFSNIYANALKILGEDGLYHALNIAGLPEGEAQAMIDTYGEELEDGLHGSRIIAESITASQIDVTSLVAAMLLAQSVQIGASAGTHIEAKGDRFSFFAGGFGWDSMSDEYLYREVEDPSGSPLSNGWYELIDGSYTLSEDTSVVSGKTYYEYIVTADSALPGEVAYIAVDPETRESTFYMARAVVVKELRFGNWMWADRANGNLALKWVGGSPS